MKQCQAMPILKWAGGKRRLISTMREHFPVRFPKRYVEPFLGGGAVLFWLLSRREEYGIEHFWANDFNSDLISMYKVIQCNVEELISRLADISAKFQCASNPDKFYFDMREEYNVDGGDEISRAALLIFLNHTGFNGLYRVNSKGQYNVPYGKRQDVRIFDAGTLRNASVLLQGVKLTSLGFAETIDEKTVADSFYYFDPPYRPISATSYFRHYANDDFNEEKQIQLAKYCGMLHEKGAKWMLSNSDTRIMNPDDDFYERHFSGFRINSIMAARMINSDASKRGKVGEVLITNYQRV